MSGSCRWVTNLRLARTAAVQIAPGCRLRSARMPGGQPSTTQPIAGPWLSPKVVTRKQMAECVVRHGLGLAHRLSRFDKASAHGAAAASPRCPARGKPRPAARPAPTSACQSRPRNRPRRMRVKAPWLTAKVSAVRLCDPVRRRGPRPRHNSRRPAHAHSICRRRGRRTSAGSSARASSSVSWSQSPRSISCDARIGGVAVRRQPQHRRARSPW